MAVGPVAKRSIPEALTDSDFTLPEAAPAVRLGPNPGRGRDLVVGDVHGHFATLRHALAELEVGAGDRLFSLGDLVDRGPDRFQAKAWIEGADPKARFDLVVRGDHEQLMLDALGPHVSTAYRPLWPRDWNLWHLNGGDWWEEHGPGSHSGAGDSARSWSRHSPGAHHHPSTPSPRMPITCLAGRRMSPDLYHVYRSAESSSR